MPTTPADLCVVVASNDEDCLRRNLLASDMIASGAVPVQVERGAPSASVAYNRGLDATAAPYVVFAHQDVYFPPGWDRALCAAIDRLNRDDPAWALVGPFGMSLDARHVGEVWTTSLGRVVGSPPDAPLPVQSFDELVIVLRRDSGLRFDEALPLWHLYGTDIVQIAAAAGRRAYVAHLPVVHNDGFHDRLRADFTAGYDFIRRKWRDRLPLRTPVVWVTRWGMALRIYRLRAWRSLERRRAMALDPGGDPRLHSAACGWEPKAPDTGL